MNRKIATILTLAVSLSYPSGSIMADTHTRHHLLYQTEKSGRITGGYVHRIHGRVVSKQHHHSVHASGHHRDDLDALSCLSKMTYSEAGGEPLLGQYAVAFTAKTRTQYLSNSDVCGVIHARGQYTTKSVPSARQDLMKELAHKVMIGEIEDPTHGATSFDQHMSTVRRNKGYDLVRIAHHIFYKDPRITGHS